MKKPFFYKKLSVLIAFILLLAVVLSSSVVTFADNDAIEDINESVLSLVDSICYIAMLVGVLLLVWGLVQLILAFKNEDSDSRNKAATILVVAIALICLKFLGAPIVDIIMRDIGG